ncbi:hypothetical protein M5K25_019996 [Dendrobium thyrsiflorum]|uniref:Uncharacterized protein n=1 Tax=Dendrobium thyrsiflorum TaxID=117978 RepID=A0ABD0U8W3_DENTH
MADPDLDSGFIHDEQGFVDILCSPFFDVNLNIDGTVEEYLEHIIFTLSNAIEEQIGNVQWTIIAKPKQDKQQPKFPFHFTARYEQPTLVIIPFSATKNNANPTKPATLTSVPLLSFSTALDSHPFLSIDGLLSQVLFFHSMGMAAAVQEQVAAAKSVALLPLLRIEEGGEGKRNERLAD